MLEDKYLALSVGFAKWIACNHTSGQLGLLSAFFSSVADNLGIIASARDLCDSQSEDETNLNETNLNETGA